MSYIDLKTLPEEHPLRNTLLVEIGAECRRVSSAGVFNPIDPNRSLASITYNELNGPFLSFFDWRVQVAERCRCNLKTDVECRRDCPMEGFPGC